MNFVLLLLAALGAQPTGVAAKAAARHCRSSGNITPVYGQTPSRPKGLPDGREFTRDTVPPYVSFPEPGLDDPAAYQGYETRVYRDARRNAFQVYLNGRSGRVVSLWADAADESVGFTVRDSAGGPAGLAWGSSGAAIAASGRPRALADGLEAPAPVPA